MDELSEPTRRVIDAARKWQDHYGDQMHPLQIRQLAHDTVGSSYPAALIIVLGFGLDRRGERVWLLDKGGSVYVGDRETRAALVEHGLNKIRARLVGRYAPR